MNKLTYFSLIAFLLISVVSCTSKSDSRDVIELPSSNVDENKITLTASQFDAGGMKLGEIEQQPFQEVVKANGMIDVPPQYKADVTSHYGGTIKNLKLIKGEYVKKGQLLFTLENPDFVQMQQDYLESKAQLTFLKSDYERQKNLLQDNVTSQKSFLKSESDYNVTRVKLESMNKKLNLLNIKTNNLTIEQIKTEVGVFAPISGFITDVNITLGSFLNPSQVAIAIVSIDHLHLELNVFEKDLASIRVNQPITFTTQTEKNQVYQGYVHLISKNIEPEKRTISIHGHIKDNGVNKNFTPGMYIEAKIITQSEPQSALPESAVIEAGGKYYVLVQKATNNGEYLFMKKEVIIGATNEGYVQIINTAEFGKDARFLVAGGFNLVVE